VKRLAVLVTGAGSGIGLATAHALLQAGHTVFAGARRPAHLQMLQSIGATALPLDVRDAARCSRRPPRSLPPPLRRPLRPPLPPAKACTAWGTTPASAAWVSCRAGQVSIVQPGAVATDIGDNGQAGTVRRLLATEAPFAEAAAGVLAAMNAPAAPRPEAPESASNRRHAAPGKVAEVVLQALFDATPQARYLMGTRWEGDRVITALIDRLLDASASPSHRLTLTELLARVEAGHQARSADKF